MNVLPGKQLHGRAGVLLWRNGFDVFLKILADSMRLETQTHTWNTRGPGLLTEARGYRMYMHSASQFGSLGPGSRVPVPLNIMSLHTAVSV